MTTTVLRVGGRLRGRMDRTRIFLSPGVVLLRSVWERPVLRLRQLRLPGVVCPAAFGLIRVGLLTRFMFASLALGWGNEFSYLSSCYPLFCCANYGLPWYGCPRGYLERQDELG